MLLSISDINKVIISFLSCSNKLCLRHSCKQFLYLEVREGTNEVVEDVVKHNNTKYLQYFTGIGYKSTHDLNFIAAKVGVMKFFKLPDVTDKSFIETVLTTAVKYGNLEIIKLLGKTNYRRTFDDILCCYTIQPFVYIRIFKRKRGISQ